MSAESKKLFVIFESVICFKGYLYKETSSNYDVILPTQTVKKKKKHNKKKPHDVTAHSFITLCFHPKSNKSVFFFLLTVKSE